MNNISEIDALKAVDDAISAIDQEARVRVLEWANSKFLGKSTPKQAIDNNKQFIESKTESPPIKKNDKSKSGTTKKLKVSLKQMKELDFSPLGKKSSRDFVAEKNPTNQKQKCVVALYYLLRVMDLETAGIDHIYTFFKAVNWPAPTNFANTIHQAGSEGWLDTADAADYKITPTGENVVDHDLPKRV